MNTPFELYKSTDKLVILKNNAKNPIDVAEFPYVSGNWEYISITRGEKHILTVIKDNGETFSFDWGRGGYTIISENLEKLKKEAVSFIENDNHILLDATTNEKPIKATVYYNDAFEKWQVWFGYKDNTKSTFYSDKATCVEEMLEEVKLFNPKLAKVKKEIAKTGIDVWRIDEIEEPINTKTKKKSKDER